MPIVQDWGQIGKIHIPPTMAHTLVRKCKNETFSSVKVTCKMKFQYNEISKAWKETEKIDL
jgi:hypothetical protein